MATVTLEQPAIRKTDAWKHQLGAYAYCLDQSARWTGTMLDVCMGGGKSKIAIDLACNMGHQTILIHCPAAVMPVWRGQIGAHAGYPLEVAILDRGSVARKVKQAAKFRANSRLCKKPCVVVINYESARMPAFAAWSLNQPWDMIILDESHRAKCHGHQPTAKYIRRLGLMSRHKLCLTGTPMPHSPLDIFSQYRFLDRSIFGAHFHKFRDRYARCNAMFPSKVEEWLNVEEFQEKLGRIYYRVTKDVLDLPSIQHHQRRFELSGKGKKAYRDLERDLITKIDDGTVTAANALVKLLRLQQVTSGFLIDDDTKKPIELDDSKSRILEEILFDLPDREPVVVFCQFTRDLAQVRKVTEKLGRRYGELSGDSKSGLTDTGTMAEDIDILGAQIHSGSVGVDLTRAAYCVYYSVGFNGADYSQSLDRTHRPGQDRPVNYFHLIASGTVDDMIYSVLGKRKDLIEAILEGLKR